LEGAITLDLPKNLMVVIQNFMNDCALAFLNEKNGYLALCAPV
jgi:hypothetical protein